MPKFSREQQKEIDAAVAKAMAPLSKGMLKLEGAERRKFERELRTKFELMVLQAQKAAEKKLPKK